MSQKLFRSDLRNQKMIREVIFYLQQTLPEKICMQKMIDAHFGYFIGYTNNHNLICVNIECSPLNRTQSANLAKIILSVTRIDPSFRSVLGHI